MRENADADTITPLPLYNSTEGQKWRAQHTEICDCCGLTPKKNRYVRTGLVTDHDHRSGVVRGAVCNSCNVLIGRYENGRTIRKDKLAVVERYLLAASSQIGQWGIALGWVC